MAKQVPLSEVRFRLLELVQSVQARDEEVVVTLEGKPAAVLLSYSEYELLRDTIHILTQPDLIRRIRAAQEQESAGSELPALERPRPGFPQAPTRSQD